MLTKYRKNPGDIDLIGYDYAENMIRLAALFQEHLPVEYNLDGYFEIDRIRNMLKSRDLSDYQILITFGHVLIQVKDSSEAMQNFVRIINNMLPSNCVSWWLSMLTVAKIYARILEMPVTSSGLI